MRHLKDPAAGPPPGQLVDRRMMAIVLALVGAACLLVAAFSKSWMGNDNFGGLVRDPDARGNYFQFRGDIRFGPLGFEQCAKPYRGFEMRETPAEIACTSRSTAAFNAAIGEAAGLDRARYTSGAFSPAGWIAFASCLLAAAGLIAAAALALARKQKELPISPASVALLAIMGAMASGCVFIATKPGPVGMLGVDLGFWAFGAGTVIGILGAQLLAKELRPPDPDLLAGAMTLDDFSAFPTGREPPAGDPPAAPPAPVPPTQPVEALVDEPAAEPPAGDSPDGAGKPGEISS